ncbi:MAG: CPBP family intramembrane metalloprotease [Candidatus Omnitrophica bacterium]|nr:CPBP family intramembrane metalloprotease [Candidatus Omnitrophota bacterium]
MHALRLTIVYLAVVFLGGALLAPWAYQLASWGAAQSPALEWLAREPFHRYVNRALLVLAVAGLWPFFRGLGVRRWSDLGLGSSSGQWGRLALGFGLGLGSLAAVVFAAAAAGARQWNWAHSAADYGRQLLGAMLTAMVVAVLEEVLFRGALFGALRKGFRWPTALVVSSAFYALVHFFQRPASPLPINWSSGFVVLPGMLRGFIDLEQLVPGFLTLTLAGGLLGYLYQKSGTLHASIGLHAGWIFWLKWYGFITEPVPAANTWFWGTAKLIDGWFALIVLGMVGLVLWHWRHSAPAAAGNVEPPDRSPSRDDEHGENGGSGPSRAADTR